MYVCLRGCIYIQTGIEGTVTHSLCSLFLPPQSAHPPAAYFYEEEEEDEGEEEKRESLLV